MVGVRKGAIALLLFLNLYHHLLPSCLPACLRHLKKVPAHRRKSRLGL